MGEGISRREFLKAAVGGAAFLAELSLPPEVLAQIEKMFSRQEFRQEKLQDLVERLKTAVFDEKDEILWAHVTRDDKEVSINIRGGGTFNEVESVNLTPLYQDSKVKGVYIIHTHPAHNYFRDPHFPKETAARILKTRQSEFPFVPSGGDIINYAADIVRAKEKKLNRSISHMVVEPSGVWSYGVDLEHPVLQRLLFRGDSDKLSDMIIKNDMARITLDRELREQEKKIFLEGGLTEKNLARFKKWAQNRWGISFYYKPHAKYEK